MNIDSAGNLKFTSAGRRPLGHRPTEIQNGNNGEQEAGDKKSANKDAKGGKGQQGDGFAGIIYMAFASGSWKAVYAAKLRDGSPACVSTGFPNEVVRRAHCFMGSTEQRALKKRNELRPYDWRQQLARMALPGVLAFGACEGEA